VTWVTEVGGKGSIRFRIRQGGKKEEHEESKNKESQVKAGLQGKRGNHLWSSINRGRRRTSARAKREPWRGSKGIVMKKELADLRWRKKEILGVLSSKEDRGNLYGRLFHNLIKGLGATGKVYAGKGGR